MGGGRENVHNLPLAGGLSWRRNLPSLQQQLRTTSSTLQHPPVYCELVFEGVRRCPKKEWAAY